MKVEGTWEMTLRWNGKDPYKFPVTFGGDGKISVTERLFGMWTALEPSSQISLAIAQFKDNRQPNHPAGMITSFNGNVSGT